MGNTNAKEEIEEGDEKVGKEDSNYMEERDKREDKNLNGASDDVEERGDSEDGCDEEIDEKEGGGEGRVG